MSAEEAAAIQLQ